MIGVVTKRRLTLGGQADPGPRHRLLVIRPGAMPDPDMPAHDVDIGNVTLTERRASFLVDTARAYLQIPTLSDYIQSSRVPDN
jgi:hypothetical protein